MLTIRPIQTWLPHIVNLTATAARSDQRLAHRIIRLGLLASLTGLALNISAAEKTRHSSPDVLRFPVAGFKIIPMFQLSEAYNDSVFQNDQIGRQRNLLRPGDSPDSMVTKINAGVELALERRKNRFALDYALRSLNFHSSPNDDYVDQLVGGSAHLELTRRHRFDLLAQYIDAHYQRGTSFSQLFNVGANLQSALVAEPDQYHQALFDGQYRYGAPTAKGNLELKFHIDDLTFTNNRTFDDGSPRTLGWDRTDTIVTPGFYYQIRPRTFLLAQAELEFVDYHNDYLFQNSDLFGRAGQDYEKQRYFLGVTWERSAKTTGTARIGYLKQSFNRSFGDLRDTGAFTWDIGVSWLPQTYSRFELNLSRDAFPTLGFGNIRLIDSYRASWRHQWNDRITSFVDGIYQQVDNNPINRLDNIVTAHFGINYAYRPWLLFGVDYSYNNQDSVNANNQVVNNNIFSQLNYHQNLVMLYVSVNSTTADTLNLPWRGW